jgi:Ni/Co efflux regulator RcnB
MVKIMVNKLALKRMDAELAQPDHLDQHDYDPGADDNELDMDWQPTDRDSDSPDSSSSSGEDRPQRPVVRRQHRAQGLRVPPPFRQHHRLKDLRLRWPQPISFRLRGS